MKFKHTITLNIYKFCFTMLRKYSHNKFKIK